MEPVASSTVDSGARWFCKGKMYFRQLDQLTINVSTARTIDDADWLTFLEDTLAISRSLRISTRVSMICSVYAHPDARQRMTASKFLVRNGLEKMGRIAVVTDSIMMRGAMTAFSWIMPKVSIDAFRAADIGSAFHWLHEAGTFDEAQAMLAWQDAQEKLGMKPGASINPSPMR
jgi:SpoIIAA-like